MILTLCRHFRRLNYTFCHPRNEGGIVFSSVCLCLYVCLSVCLSVNTITPDLLEISSGNFQGIILWSKALSSSKLAIVGCIDDKNIDFRIKKT